MNCKKPWFAEWFDENYLEVYRHRNTEEAIRHTELIINTLNLQKTASILDLCCGDGRYSIIFKEKGYRIMGLDLSEILVRRAREKDPDLMLVIGDMRHIPGHFDLILSLFTSFGYFETDSENKQVLQTISDSLNSNGILWLDYLNPEFLCKNLVSENHFCLPDSLEIVEKRRIENNRIIKDISLVRTGCTTGKKCYRESVRLYPKEELESMFLQTGFDIIHRFGDYHGNEWTPGSERTILAGRKQK